MPKSLFVQEHTPSLAELIDQGSQLWHKEAKRRAGKRLERLWNVVGAQMSASAESQPAGIPPIASNGTPREHHLSFSAWDARLLILGGSLIPADWDGWDSNEPYPHEGLFASAFFFHEARQLLERDANAAWASLTQAYRCLEMNPPVLTASESAAVAAETRHARNTEKLRSIIIEILAGIGEDKLIRSGAKAIDHVIKAIDKDPAYKNVLNAYDSKTIKKIDPAKKASTAGDRLRIRLKKEWSRKGGPYPDVEKALRPFKQKRRTAQTKARTK